MGKIISVFSHKGGVGKTNFTYNLGFALADKGKKILFIDVDSQMNLSSYVFGKSININYKNDKSDEILDKQEKMQDILNEEWGAFIKLNRSFIDHIDGYQNNQVDVLQNKEISHYKPIYQHKDHQNINLLLGSIDGSFFEAEMNWTDIVLGTGKRFIGKRNINQKTNNDLRVYMFQRCIHDLVKKQEYGYDYVLIDTPPSATSILTALSVMSSDYFIFPTVPNFFSLQAVNNLSDIFENWLTLLDPWRQSGNNLGLTLKPKFLGILIQKARRYTREQKYHNRYTIHTRKWSDNINQKLNIFYDFALSKGLCVNKEDFSKIFPKSTPLIIDSIADFTLTLSSIAEEKGIPVINLTEQDYPSLKEQPTGTKNQNQYFKAFKSFTESYDYISNCIVNNMQ